MKSTDKGVGPKTTLAIILGAREFLRSPNLGSSPAFAKSAEDFRQYLLDSEGFALPAANLLDLFDSQKAAPEILEEISSFLISRTKDLKKGADVRDLLLYYTGHGGFTPAREYFLAVAATRQKMEGATSLRMSDLATTIKENARSFRRFLILDCCFSAAAFKEFQTAPLSAARVQTIESFPKEGTTLLCSSNARTVSIAPEGAIHTMFSGALIDILRHGVPTNQEYLSMEQLGAQIKERIRTLYADEAVRPEVLSPDQRAEDVALVPIFPNAATRPQRIKDEINGLSKELDITKTEINALKTRVEQIVDDFKPLFALSSRVESLELRSNETNQQNVKVSNSILRRDMEDQVLKDAPQYIIDAVFRWRQARVTSMACFSASLLIVSLSLFLLYKGYGLLSQNILLDPINWIPTILLLLLVASNRLRFLFLRHDNVSNFDPTVPPEAWEKLPLVISERNAKYFKFIGSILILSPWFEIILLLYLVQIFSFLLTMSQILN